MRARLLIPIVAAGAAAAFVLAGWGIAAPRIAPSVADLRLTAIPVDTELVIAVDVSNSMDPEEQALQREGYILGLTSREFLNALREGANGRVAITYFEWAAINDQKIVLISVPMTKSRKGVTWAVRSLLLSRYWTDNCAAMFFISLRPRGPCALRCHP